MKVSYAITVCNEYRELENLLSVLFPQTGPEDEIVILLDETKGSVDKIVELAQGRCEIHSGQFPGDFAAWKNQLNSYCSGDWIFQLDADELPSEMLIQNLHQILESTEAEMIAVPRQNLVEGITPQDIQEWHWNVTKKGINWPDYQWRLYRNNSKIHWVGKVHERPVGALKYAIIPDDQFIYRLDHFKAIEKQRSQNNYYSKLVSSK